MRKDTPGVRKRGYIGIESDFLLLVFQEVNDHMRNTEQKYLIITAAYIGLISVLVSTFGGRQAPGDPLSIDPTIVSLFSHLFFLVIGLTVYVMQAWYRTWKEHYLKVCLDLKRHFVQRQDNPALFPYWLRQDFTKTRTKLLIDNFLKYLTFSTNVFLAVLISGAAAFLSKSRILDIAFMAFVAGCLVFPILLERKIRRDRFLLA